jgi:hypothetical protein
MPLEISDRDWSDAEKAILEYGKARLRFREAQHRLEPCKLLSGNDNKVGIAGEFWAKRLFKDRGWLLDEVPSGNNPGYDLIIRKGSRRRHVSVKAVSDESKSGKQVQMRANARWDFLLLVLLSDTLQPYRYGLVTRHQYKAAIKAGSVGRQPRVSRSWLGDGGWLYKYGEVKDWK